MLVLTRRADQSIVIGDRIKVTVLDVKSNSVSLGIDAPEHVPIAREELVNLVDSGVFDLELAGVG